MPRVPRTFMDYPCYHIITRGNQRQTVFMNEKERCLLSEPNIIDEVRGHFEE